MATIEQQLEFLRMAGVKTSTLVPLARDASARLYVRLQPSDRPMLLVIDRTSQQEINQFVAVQQLLRDGGLSVPEIYEKDTENGLFLVEDFGSSRFDDALFKEHLEPLEASIQALIGIQTIRPLAGLPRWGAEELIEASFQEFFSHWWPAARGEVASIEVRSELNEILKRLFATWFFAECDTFVHRDYFANNLMWLPQRSGAQRTGILDFQHASIGFKEYDLASFVDDVRNGITSEVRDAAIDRYCSAFPATERHEISSRIEICSFIRLLRIAGLWARLVYVEGRADYGRFFPRTWSLLNKQLDLPAMREVKSWFQKYIISDNADLPTHISFIRGGD